MKILYTKPGEDGFRMPGEFEEHQGCLMIWPERPGSWAYGAQSARRAFAQIAAAIAESETVFMLAGKGAADSARAMLPSEINIQIVDSDDAWARDAGPTFVKNGAGIVRGIDWKFNAWGGEYDGLYSSWEKDDKIAQEFCQENGYDVYDARPFVLEGGSVHTDGEGTLLVTEACLLSPGRNPSLTKREIETRLRDFLGVTKIIWLPHGIYNDETNEHVDNVCAFLRPGEVVLAWTDNPADPQYAYSQSCWEVLSRETDAMGRSIQVHKLPIPDVPVRITAEDLAGLSFEEGEDTREVGERLAASYVNFYFSNGAVILPQFGGENMGSDRRAAEILTKLCPDRRVIPIDARDILIGGGNIHCITQQIPKGGTAL